jgi:pyruvate dehydrogenase E1 component beta subunit
MYANVPGLKVITPYTPYDAKGLLKAAIRDNDPVLFMESERMYGDKGEIPEGEYLLPIGVADVKRVGKDVTIVSFGKVMKVALDAAELLAKEGIEAEVIDLRTIRPMDHATIIKSVQKTNRLVVVDENWPVASISSEIAFRVQKDAFDFLDAPVLRVCQADTPLPFTPSLIDASLPSVDRTVRAVKEVMYLVK